MREFRPLRLFRILLESMACPVCRTFVSDWLRQPPRKDSEFYTSIRRKGIMRRHDEISEALFRITECLQALNPQTIVRSHEYNADALLDFYKSGVDIMTYEQVPIEQRPMVRMFYRNELIKCVFKQTCNTDLEYVLAVITDEGCSKDMFILAQWVSECLFALRPLQMIHNDHRNYVKL